MSEYDGARLKVGSRDHIPLPPRVIKFLRQVLSIRDLRCKVVPFALECLVVR